jgi:hypothetical protein
MSKSQEILNLIKNIETNCHTQEIKLADILRQCKSLAYKLDYSPLKNWVNYELIGYSEEMELPDYRIVEDLPLVGDLQGLHFGNIVFLNQRPLGIKSSFPKEHIRSLHTRPFYENVAGLQEIIDSFKGKSIPFSLPISIYPYLETYTNASLVRAYRLVSVDIVVGILDTIKTRILDFILEIQDIHLDFEYDNLNMIDSIFKEFILKSNNISNLYINTIHSVGTMTNNPGGFSIDGSVGGNVNNVQGDGNRVVQGDTTMTGDRNINTGGGNYNERIQGNYVQGNYYAAGQPQSLAEAAAEIQKLLEQLDKTYPSNTTIGKMAIATETLARIEGDKSMSERVLSVLKAGGVSAFEQLLNHPAASFVIGALEDWKNTKGT